MVSKASILIQSLNCQNTLRTVVEKEVTISNILGLELFLSEAKVQNFKMEKLNIRRKEHMYIIMFKVLHNLAPDYMKISLPSKSYHYSLRTAMHISLPKPKTNSCKRTFLYRGASMYNQLPSHLITNSSTIQSFKSNIQSYLYES